MKTLYDVLNVSPTASEQEITSTYLALLRVASAEEASELTHAWVVLHDPVKRMVYTVECVLADESLALALLGQPARMAAIPQEGLLAIARRYRSFALAWLNDPEVQPVCALEMWLQQCVIRPLEDERRSEVYRFVLSPQHLDVLYAVPRFVEALQGQQLVDLFNPDNGVIAIGPEIAGVLGLILQHEPSVHKALAHLNQDVGDSRGENAFRLLTRLRDRITQGRANPLSGSGEQLVKSFCRSFPRWTMAVDVLETLFARGDYYIGELGDEDFIPPSLETRSIWERMKPRVCPNYYIVLDVKPDDPLQTLEAQYFAMLETVTDPQFVQQAYDTLSDPTKRRAYHMAHPEHLAKFSKPPCALYRYWSDATEGAAIFEELAHLSDYEIVWAIQDLFQKPEMQHALLTFLEREYVESLQTDWEFQTLDTIPMKIAYAVQKAMSAMPRPLSARACFLIYYRIAEQGSLSAYRQACQHALRILQLNYTDEDNLLKFSAHASSMSRMTSFNLSERAWWNLVDEIMVSLFQAIPRSIPTALDTFLYVVYCLFNRHEGLALVHNPVFRDRLTATHIKLLAFAQPEYANILYADPRCVAQFPRVFVDTLMKDARCTPKSFLIYLRSLQTLLPPDEVKKSFAKAFCEHSEMLVERERQKAEILYEGRDLIARNIKAVNIRWFKILTNYRQHLSVEQQASLHVTFALKYCEIQTVEELQNATDLLRYRRERQAASMVEIWLKNPASDPQSLVPYVHQLMPISLQNDSELNIVCPTVTLACLLLVICPNEPLSRQTKQYLIAHSDHVWDILTTVMASRRERVLWDRAKALESTLRSILSSDPDCEARAAAIEQVNWLDSADRSFYDESDGSKSPLGAEVCFLLFDKENYLKGDYQTLVRHGSPENIPRMHAAYVTRLKTIREKALGIQTMPYGKRGSSTSVTTTTEIPERRDLFRDYFLRSEAIEWTKQRRAFFKTHREQFLEDLIQHIKDTKDLSVIRDVLDENTLIGSIVGSLRGALNTFRAVIDNTDPTLLKKAYAPLVECPVTRLPGSPALTFNWPHTIFPQTEEPPTDRERLINYLATDQYCLVQVEAAKTIFHKLAQHKAFNEAPLRFQGLYALEKLNSETDSELLTPTFFYQSYLKIALSTGYRPAVEQALFWGNNSIKVELDAALPTLATCYPPTRRTSPVPIDRSMQGLAAFVCVMIDACHDKPGIPDLAGALCARITKITTDLSRLGTLDAGYTLRVIRCLFDRRYGHTVLRDPDGLRSELSAKQLLYLAYVDPQYAMLLFSDPACIVRLNPAFCRDLWPAFFHQVPERFILLAKGYVAQYARNGNVQHYFSEALRFLHGAVEQHPELLRLVISELFPMVNIQRVFPRLFSLEETYSWAGMLTSVEIPTDNVAIWAMCNFQIGLFLLQNTTTPASAYFTKTQDIHGHPVSVLEVGLLNKLHVQPTEALMSSLEIRLYALRPLCKKVRELGEAIGWDRSTSTGTPSVRHALDLGSDNGSAARNLADEGPDLLATLPDKYHIKGRQQFCDITADPALLPLAEFIQNPELCKPLLDYLWIRHFKDTVIQIDQGFREQPIVFQLLYHLSIARFPSTEVSGCTAAFSNQLILSYFKQFYNQYTPRCEAARRQAAYCIIRDFTGLLAECNRSLVWQHHSLAHTHKEAEALRRGELPPPRLATAAPWPERSGSWFTDLDPNAIFHDTSFDGLPPPCLDVDFFSHTSLSFQGLVHVLALVRDESRLKSQIDSVWAPNTYEMISDENWQPDKSFVQALRTQKESRFRLKFYTEQTDLQRQLIRVKQIKREIKECIADLESLGEFTPEITLAMITLKTLLDPTAQTPEPLEGLFPEHIALLLYAMEIPDIHPVVRGALEFWRDPITTALEAAEPNLIKACLNALIQDANAADTLSVTIANLDTQGFDLTGLNAQTHKPSITQATAALVAIREREPLGRSTAPPAEHDVNITVRHLLRSTTETLPGSRVG